MNSFDPHRKIPIGISSCLLGEQVRYDGGHRHNSLITTQLSGIFEFRPLCPFVRKLPSGWVYRDSQSSW
jgi:uncharacterized protein YbbK (DUF523 family)